MGLPRWKVANNEMEDEFTTGNGTSKMGSNR
jgi:hypothetical protein